MYITTNIHRKEMDIENNGAAGALLKSECYICMELCITQSPCECKSHVHPPCLIKFIETSGNTHCTICNGQYPVEPPPPTPSKIRHKNIIHLLFWFGLFFAFGCIGACTTGDCQDYDPFSVNSWCSALTGYFVIILIWGCSRSYNRR